MHLESPLSADALQHAPRSAGFARFVPPDRTADIGKIFKAQQFLWVGIQDNLAHPGQLRACVDDAVESALALRGALPPSLDIGAQLDAIIADQVFRTLALGARGLALALPRLCSHLDHQDSATVAAWINASRKAPVVLVFQEEDRQANVLWPVPLHDLVAQTSPPETLPQFSGTESLSSNPIPSVAFSSLKLSGNEEIRAGVANDFGEVSLGVDRIPVEAELPPTPSQKMVQSVGTAAAHVPQVDRPRVQEGSKPQRGPECGTSGQTPKPGLSDVHVEVAQTAKAVEKPAADPRPRGVLPPRSSLAARQAAPQEHPGRPLPPKPDKPVPVVKESPAGSSTSNVTVINPAPESEPLPPTRRERRPIPGAKILEGAELRTLAMELDEARGPKPVRVIEQLFVTHYMPLLMATLSTNVDHAVRGIVDDWRANFEHSYREAFSALRVTGKRPAMVFDAPEIAAKLGRINGARAIKLILIDAMRFDLGERVGAQLKETLSGKAVLVERMLLWSALPTTTAMQLSLLARGPEGLRDQAPSSEPQPAIARGRSVAMLRRERVGTRELMKLDLVEARIRTLGPPLPERIEGIAEEVSDVVAKFIEELPTRTLVLVMGDHGFRISPTANGNATSPAVQGGASPEEVLVPAYAWLVGGVH